MYFIITLLFQGAYFQCFQKQNKTDIYLSPGETLKLDLQDYIYGKQLKYHSSIDCMNEKLEVRNITLMNIQMATYSGATLCYDPVTGIQQEQSIQYQVKDTTLTVMFFDMASGRSVSFYRTRITIDKYVKCENIICLKLNETLIDCHSLQQQKTTFFVINASNEKSYNFSVNNTDYGKILAEKPINSTYIFYRLVSTYNNNDRLDKYQINIPSLTIMQNNYIDKFTYKSGLTGLTLFSFTIYNNGIYLLSKEEGLCYFREEKEILYCWDFDDQFNVFSVFVQQNGQHSIILGSTNVQNKSESIYKALLSEDDFTITSFYKLRDNANLIQVFHNQQYTILIGTDKKKVFAEIYSHMNDFTSNLYKVIDSLQDKEEVHFFYFDSIQNQAISINNKSIIVATVQTSYLTINDKECYSESLVINATQQGVETFCEITFKVNLLEEGSEDIYDVQEMNQTVVVLNKSINTFDLNNYVIGPNINYYLFKPLQSDDEDFEMIQFKEGYKISYQQTIDATNIVYNKAFISQEESNFDYYQIIQWKDLSAEIFRCSIFETEKFISCYFQQSLQMKNKIQQILTGFKCLYGCFVIRQDTKVILYMEINNLFAETTCTLEYESEIEAITYIDGNYFTILQNNTIQIFKGHFIRNECNLEKVFQTDSTELEQLVNVTNIDFFNVRTNNYMYNLYISTNVGLIVIDPGLLRYRQIQLLWFVKFNDQFDTVLQIINNKVVRLNYNQINIIHLIQPYGYYYEKILPIFNYTITNTTNSKVGLECNLLYIQARDSNQSDVIIVYKLDQSQISSFHTTFSKVNKLDFNVISKKSHEFFLIQVTSAQKLYANVQLHYKSSQSKIIKILFEGFLAYAKMMDLNVNVKTSEKQYDLTLLINNETQQLHYTNPNEKYIKLEGYNDFIEGSVSEWDIKCDSCFEDLQLINNINFNSYLTSIPNTTQIKHTYDYVLIQQEQNILAIDGKGKAKYLIQLPIPDSSTKCTSITASVQNFKTRLVVSVCSTTQKASFYITSFLSSFPTPIGPFYSPVLIHQITHIRMMNELLFILDVVTEYVYIFNLTIQDLQTDQLTIVEQLDARAFTADLNQVFVSFDVAYQNESYIMWLVTNTSQLVLFTYPNELAYSYDLPTNLQQMGFLDLPSNIIPQSLLVAEFGKKENYYYYLIIIANLNYHHYELEVQFEKYGNEVLLNVFFLRAYMQYGYYYAMGKIRVSEANEGFFGLIYESPLDDKKKVLAIYDRKNNNTEKLRKILGGYRIVTNNQILFDFLHYSKPKDEFSYGIILTDGATINLLTLSRYLALKVNYLEFYNQNMTFNASNDFGKWVSFKVNIYNEIGPNFFYMFLALGLFFLFVLTISALYVRNKLKKMKYKIFPEIQIVEEEEKQLNQI